MSKLPEFAVTTDDPRHVVCQIVVRRLLVSTALSFACGAGVVWGLMQGGIALALASGSAAAVVVWLWASVRAVEIALDPSVEDSQRARPRRDEEATLDGEHMDDPPAGAGQEPPS